MSNGTEKTGGVTLALTKEEALVLFEFLSRFSDTEVLSLEDKAEERVLWDMCCMLEKVLVEPFDENYSQLLHDARAQIRDSD